MANLICTAITSLDGYVNDETGNFDWAAPDDEVHAFVNELERPVGTYLYGRRLYETMAFWETGGSEPSMPAPVRQYAEIWRAADKVVYSTTLPAVSSPRTRLERRFDPEAVRRMKAEAERDLSVGGPGLAADAFRAGLVDELRVVLTPWVVGGGTHLLPDGVRLELELLDERRFTGGAVFLHYRVH
jgi:dihydrofolate reductase